MTLDVTGTSVAPGAGLKLVTVGRVVSAELAVIPEFEELALAPNRLVVEGLLF